jgi:hypothetical protein
MHIMRQLMHHDHLNLPGTHPATILPPKHQLNNLAIVEVPPDKLAIGFVFFKGGNGKVVRLHDGETLRGDGTEEGVGVVVVGEEGWRASEGLDEGDTIVGVG